MARLQRTSWAFGATAALGFVALFACGVPSRADSQPIFLAVDPTPLVAETSKGARKFSIEVADEVDERTAGLMYRTSMPDDRGMLFVFESTQQVGFWMKDTPMPLDLLFVGQDGRVKDIERGEPLSEALIAPGEPVRFVLEFKAGTAAGAGIVPGTKLDHPVIDQAAGATNPG